MADVTAETERHYAEGGLTLRDFFARGAGD